jgi:hypothetical protein
VLLSNFIEGKTEFSMNLNRKWKEINKYL